MTTCKCIDVEALANSCRQWSMDPVLVSAGLPRSPIDASFANGPNLGHISICEVCIPRVFSMPLDEGRRHMSTYLMNVRTWNTLWYGYSASQRKLIGILLRIEMNNLKSIKKRSTVSEMILLDFQIG